jgi:hypothetical protein
MDNENTTGISLVVEHIRAIAVFRKLSRWFQTNGISQFDCWGDIQRFEHREINPFVFDPLVLGCQVGLCKFSGGTHSMLFFFIACYGKAQVEGNEVENALR